MWQMVWNRKGCRLGGIGRWVVGDMELVRMIRMAK